MGPPLVPSSNSTPSPSASKTLPMRRNTRNASANLRASYHNSSPESKVRHVDPPSITSLSSVLTSPNLPPTPPSASNGDIVPDGEEAAAESALLRPALVTPTNQHSPPTPDNTPPRQRVISPVRPFLDTQPSMASTRAESFRTAREEITSDDESDTHAHQTRGYVDWQAMNGPVQPVHHLRHTIPLGRSPLGVDVAAELPILKPGHEAADITSHTTKLPGTVQVYVTEGHDFELQYSPENFILDPYPLRNRDRESLHLEDRKPNVHADEPLEPSPATVETRGNLRRGQSLRDRLLAAQTRSHSPSTEKFASIIGWNNSVPSVGNLPDTRDESQQETRRFSGVSTTSTVEAYLIEQNPLPRRATTLRHVTKHESLRSVSSPLPASNRQSMDSPSDSPHRLVHKKARLSNQNRWSFGSEVSRSYSLASSAALPKTEIIRVAVIPERSSSLSSTKSGSHGQSNSTTSGKSHSRKMYEVPPSSWQHKRAFSESQERGRSPVQAPAVPPRSSSLSAPTSRTTSRANSITSENLRVRRQEAEKDLRKTLDRMESERLVQSMQDAAIVDQEKLRKAGQLRSSLDQPSLRRPYQPTPSLDVHDADEIRLVTPGTKEWAALRPPSILETPFSQQSYQSASPELSEAMAINFFPHNNHSLQLIEQNPVAESKAVREVQRQGIPANEVDSPLRNPRRPPEPPLFNFIPPTPADEAQSQLALDSSPLAKRFGSVRRPGQARQRSESLMNAVGRSLSLKDARNRKAGQDLDGSLHPFWRPRAFWDDVPGSSPEKAQGQARSMEPELISNSLGLPQERTVINGPVSLVRRISERRRQRRGVVKQSSHSSLGRIRTAHRLHKSPLSSLHLRLGGIKDIQSRFLHARQRKEDEARERRRADLRKSIGANIVHQGDSRFPASNASLSR